MRTFGRQLTDRIPASGFVPLRWKRTHVFDPDIAPSVRDSPGLCYDGKGGLLLFGGKTKGGDYKTYFNDLWRFDYGKNRWHMYTEAAKVYDGTKWDMSVGLRGKQPTSRSSNTMIVRREGDRGSEEDLLYIAGGSDRQGKCTDVRKLVLEPQSPDYLRWNELLGGSRKVAVEGDIAVQGDPPKRGFCCKVLRTQNAIFAPQFGNDEILQLDLFGKEWGSLKFDNLVAWRTSKLFCFDFQVMTRFLSIDFIGNSDDGYPGVETGEAWNVFKNADANDNRENGASKQWLLCPSQVMRFKSLSSFGDKPGTLSAHSLSGGLLYRGHRGRPPHTRIHCFGGCRLGGKALLPPLPPEWKTPQIVGRDHQPHVGMRVKANPAFWERIAQKHRQEELLKEQAFKRTTSLARTNSFGSLQSHGTKVSDVPDVNSDVLGLIMEINEDEEVMDDFGRCILKKRAHPFVMVRFDGRSEDLHCLCGQDGVYDLVEYVDYSLYTPSGGMKTNELWAIDIKESSQLTALIGRISEVKKLRGFTDQFSLVQVLGRRINIKTEGPKRTFKKERRGAVVRGVA